MSYEYYTRGWGRVVVGVGRSGAEDTAQSKLKIHQSHYDTNSFAKILQYLHTVLMSYNMYYSLETS